MKTKNSLNAPVVFSVCKLAEFRATLGITQPDMAKKIGMSASSLWKIEQGTDVKLTTARKIAKAYGKTIEEIWPMAVHKKNHLTNGVKVRRVRQLTGTKPQKTNAGR